MRLEDYTDDAICRAMGLKAFLPDSDDSSINHRILRFVFRPSFHPEVAINFVDSDSGSEANVVALRTLLWLEMLPCRLPEDSERVILKRESIAELFEALLAYAKSPEARRSGVCIDGMGISAVYRKNSETISFLGHACGSREYDAIAKLAVQLAWNAASLPGLKNALANVAGYLDKKYPLLEVPPSQPLTRLLILGTPDERKGYFEMLQTTRKEG